MKLQKREIGSFTFERDLPVYLAGDGAEACFIRFEARPSGRINPKYVALMEATVKRGTVMDMRANQLIDGPEDADFEAFVEMNANNSKVAAKDRLSALYQACVVNWETNILDGDAILESTRENFLALAEVQGHPEIADAILALEAECMKAGVAQKKADEEEMGNSQGRSQTD